MAFSDYYLCDQCGGKAFYDAQLQYERQPDGTNKLGYVGDMAVLCDACANNHKVVIVAKNDPESALVTELRALAERMQTYRGQPMKQQITDAWLSELDSLLSAHGGAEGQGNG